MESIRTQVKNALWDICIETGYETKGEEAEKRMVDKFVQMVEKYDQMYCPCHMTQNADTLCPCKFMREYGACRCGLFKKVEVTK